LRARAVISSNCSSGISVFSSAYLTLHFFSSAHQYHCHSLSTTDIEMSVFFLSRAGACLLSGVGLPRDEVEALAHFARAAELNYAPAQYQIGMRACVRRLRAGAGG
jgi:hypothetical protein